MDNNTKVVPEPVRGESDLEQIAPAGTENSACAGGTLPNEGRANRKIVIVECARGFAAIYIFFGHFVLVSGAEKSFHFANYVFHLFGYGRQVVLLFFLLSGFSIHYSNRKHELSERSVLRNYFYLRFRRIYPLFLLAVGLTLLLVCVSAALNLPMSEPAKTQLKPERVLATLSFLMALGGGGHWWVVFPSNDPLWSLPYEVLYYLLYPLFWRGMKSFGIKRAFLTAILISLSALIAKLEGVSGNLVTVFALYWLWCAGAVLAERCAIGRVCSISPSRFYGIILLLLGCSQLLVKPYIMSDMIWGLLLGVVMWGYPARFSHEEMWNRILGIFILGVLTLGLIFLEHHLPLRGGRKLLDTRLVLSALVLGTMLTGRLTLRGLCGAVLHPFEKAGAWSYGLYITHYPLLVFGAAFLAAKHFSPLLVILMTPVIFWFAKALELKLQPRVVQWMDAIFLRKRSLRNGGFLSATPRSE